MRQRSPLTSVKCGRSPSLHSRVSTCSTIHCFLCTAMRQLSTLCFSGSVQRIKCCRRSSPKGSPSVLENCMNLRLPIFRSVYLVYTSKLSSSFSSRSELLLSRDLFLLIFIYLVESCPFLFFLPIFYQQQQQQSIGYSSLASLLFSSCVCVTWRSRWGRGSVVLPYRLPIRKLYKSPS